MYICLCNAVTERAVYEAVERGIRSYRELSFRTGCGTQCGTCARTARQLFQEAIRQRGHTMLRVVGNNPLAA